MITMVLATFAEPSLGLWLLLRGAKIPDSGSYDQIKVN